ncbi:Methyltransferase OMS1 [Picochlorum sp. SENEW3]|nr:Methyltransferase OMS1 [Picochlorum sp. SENEW3]
MRLQSLVKGGIVYLGATIGAYTYVKGQKIKNASGEEEHQEDSMTSSAWNEAKSNSIFRSLAPKYDASIHMDEMVLGMLLLRRWLIRTYATGKVLEVSAGTGRNFKYYDTDKVTSLICTDRNRDMLLEAKEKSGDLNVTFAVADVLDLTSGHDSVNRGGGGMGDAQTVKEHGPYGPALRQPVQFPENHFDTVVDSFGLCSCADPVHAVREMTKTLKPGGILILLEHGKGTWSFINSILDSQERIHFDKWGCNFNRDIAQVIGECSNDLFILQMQRWHFGTTYCIVAQKKGKP